MRASSRVRVWGPGAWTRGGGKSTAIVPAAKRSVKQSLLLPLLRGPSLAGESPRRVLRLKHHLESGEGVVDTGACRAQAGAAVAVVEVALPASGISEKRDCSGSSLCTVRVAVQRDELMERRQFRQPARINGRSAPRSIPSRTTELLNPRQGNVLLLRIAHIPPHDPRDEHAGHGRPMSLGVRLDGHPRPARKEPDPRPSPWLPARPTRTQEPQRPYLVPPARSVKNNGPHARDPPKWGAPLIPPATTR